MDLSKTKNQILVADNWHEYKDKIDIPKEMEDLIETYWEEYRKGIHARGHLFNMTIHLFRKHFNNE
jgi:hypothetical protein